MPLQPLHEGLSSPVYDGGGAEGIRLPFLNWSGQTHFKNQVTEN